MGTITTIRWCGPTVRSANTGGRRTLGLGAGGAR